MKKIDLTSLEANLSALRKILAVGALAIALACGTAVAIAVHPHPAEACQGPNC